MALASSNTSRTTSESSRKPFNITPSDSVDLAVHARGLHANKEGWIRVTGVDDDDGSYADLYVLKGADVPVWVKRVWAAVAGTPICDEIAGYA